MSTPIVDVVDRDNRPRGFRVDVNHAMRYGQWFRGVHVLVYTPAGDILIERRSRRIPTYPDRLDLSLSGIVDAGEHPQDTALRELEEEVGLVAKPSELELISVNRYNHRWPSLHARARNIMYHYLVQLPHRYVPLQLQRSEVAEAQFVSLSTARQLIRQHQLAHLGRLEPRYAMYAFLLDAVGQRLAAPTLPPETAPILR
ncbi:MAG TPA: NUDIX domain-containing protein [Candidatus Saccharimonadia bacterium]